MNNRKKSSESRRLFFMDVGGAKKDRTEAAGLQGDLGGQSLAALCHLIGLFG